MQSDRSFGVWELLGILWHLKRVVMGTIATCGIAFMGLAWFLPKQYVATALVLPVASQPTSNLGGLLNGVSSQIGGLASLAGLSLSSTGEAKEEALATLRSDVLVRDYILELLAGDGVS